MAGSPNLVTFWLWGGYPTCFFSANGFSKKNSWASEEIVGPFMNYIKRNYMSSRHGWWPFQDWNLLIVLYSTTTKFWKCSLINSSLGNNVNVLFPHKAFYCCFPDLKWDEEYYQSHFSYNNYETPVFKARKRQSLAKI